MKKIIGFTTFILVATLFSCQDEKIENPAADEIMYEKAAQITFNEAGVEAALTELEYEIDFYANAVGPLHALHKMGKMWKWTNKLRYHYQHCPSIEIESEGDGYPKTITLDYGEGTELKNGKVLSGVIIIEIAAPRNSGEHQRNVTYRNFGVDTLTFNGTAVVTVDREEEMFRKFVSDLMITFDDGTSIARTSERIWQWVGGLETELDQTDDMMQITGFANAETSAGDVYRKEITEPLIRIRDCRYIVQGIVEITLNGDLISLLDYGDGTCDEFAWYTSNGETVEVDLSKRKMNNKRKGDENKRTTRNGNGNGGMNG